MKCLHFILPLIIVWGYVMFYSKRLMLLRNLTIFTFLYPDVTVLASLLYIQNVGVMAGVLFIVFRIM